MKAHKKGNKTLYQYMTQAKKQAKPEQVPVVVLFDHTYPNGRAITMHVL
jgi:hypothetical protein